MIVQHEAKKEPFEAFGILYYPLFARRAELAGVEASDAHMAWAVTANENLTGTGYTLSRQSVLALAAYRQRMAERPDLAPDELIDPLADLARFVPNVDVTPFYPGFPAQVMEISEAQYRFDQMCHYLSTYGAEELAGLAGLSVFVREGWRPAAGASREAHAAEGEDEPRAGQSSQPRAVEKGACRRAHESQESPVAPTVIHVLLTKEDLESVVAARLKRATRMHPAELACVLLPFDDLEDADAPLALPPIAFHENMLELIRLAAAGSSTLLERVVASLAQHPGDLLKAVTFLVRQSPRHRLAARQKKALCRAFERFSATDIAQNLADAGRVARRAPAYLSVARFGGENLREALRLVESGEVRSWAGGLERRWMAVDYAAAGSTTSAQTPAWRDLLTCYGQRPGVLLRSLVRLVRHGCPPDLLREELLRHANAYALPTLVRTLTVLGGTVPSYMRMLRIKGARPLAPSADEPATRAMREHVCELLRELLALRLRELDTPFAGRRVYLDAQNISLAGSALVPNETGNTGTAWPPVGIAFELPPHKTLRFFCFWDERRKRVDVDLHFVGLRRTKLGAPEVLHVGWDGDFRADGMLTSGDVTTSVDAVEYLDLDLDAARKAGVELVVQRQFIYAGALSWGGIATCFAGALVVDGAGEGSVDGTPGDAALYDPANLLFRDDLTGEGRSMDYAVINVRDCSVRLLRGAAMPVGELGFSLGSYLELLFETQGATLVDEPEQAEVRVCVGRSADPAVVSLFDAGFYIS